MGHHAQQFAFHSVFSHLGHLGRHRLVYSLEYDSCSPRVGCVTSAILLMLTKDTLATAKLKAGHRTIALLKLGDIGANFVNHTHELMPEHITLFHAYSTIDTMRAA